jgi:hypothetical protein
MCLKKQQFFTPVFTGIAGVIAKQMQGLFGVKTRA